MYRCLLKSRKNSENDDTNSNFKEIYIFIIHTFSFNKNRYSFGI